MIIRLFLFILVLFLGSCSGYRFHQKRNPFLANEIKSIAIPMFVNKTSIADVTTPFCRELSIRLSSFSGLKIIPGESASADAVLVGIVSSIDHKDSLFAVTGQDYSEQALGSAIGTRKPFYLPSSVSYKLQISLFLIKRPSKLERELLVSDHSKFVTVGNKVILQKSFNLSGSYSSILTSGDVNLTQTKAMFEQSIINLSKQFSEQFNQEVLHAF